MLAVHFGAGNIGRGFIGLLLNKAGYHTTFVDVNDKLINELNEQKEYNVVLASEKSETIRVTDVSGLNSMENPEQVIQAIADADIVTTAVGPNSLGKFSELIAKGLEKRSQVSKRPLNLIACENMIGGSALLKSKVFDHLSEENKTEFNSLYGFPDAVVDRIVPNQMNEDPLEVAVEPYYEWVVEEPKIVGEKPPIDGITYVDDLTPYLERKLFTVNTGNAIPAYIGYFMGYSHIQEAMEDEKIRHIIEGALKESGEVLIRKYNFDSEEHQRYIDKTIERFLNPYISDEVTRVARGPVRKLEANDRLIRPAKLYMDLTGEEPVYLATVIAAVLLYDNKEDEEAFRLQSLIDDSGLKNTLQTVSDLEATDPLLPVVLNQVENLLALKQ